MLKLTRILLVHLAKKYPDRATWRLAVMIIRKEMKNEMHTFSSSDDNNSLFKRPRAGKIVERNCNLYAKINKQTFRSAISCGTCWNKTRRSGQFYDFYLVRSIGSRSVPVGNFYPKTTFHPSSDNGK